jgi:hypothetical protein
MYFLQGNLAQMLDKTPDQILDSDMIQHIKVCEKRKQQEEECREKSIRFIDFTDDIMESDEDKSKKEEKKKKKNDTESEEEDSHHHKKKEEKKKKTFKKDV